MKSAPDTTFLDLHFEVPSEMLESVMYAMAPFTVNAGSKRRCHLLYMTRRMIRRASPKLKARAKAKVRFSGITKGEMDMLLHGAEAGN